MFLITCPYCGERDQSEFKCGGEAHIARPQWRDDMTDEEWADFVFLRKNEKGIIAERWNHQAGCGKWFNALRSSVTDKFYAFYEIGAPMPDIPQEHTLTPCGELVGSGNDAVKVRVETQDKEAAE